MKESPVVTAIMPTMNRREDLRETLIRLQEQDYPNIEIVVVDNASKDGTSDMVRSEFPHVQLISLPKNIGNIAGRNVAMKNARGKYILCLDDDSFPGKNVVCRVVEEFEGDEKLGLIACGILDYKKFWSPQNLDSLKDESVPPVDGKGKDVVGWVGCGGAFRRDLFEQAGYWEEWGIVGGAWEWSLAARILNLGYKIKAFRDIYVYHQWSQKGDPAKNRLSEIRMFEGCRIPALFYMKYYPLDLLLFNVWRWVYAISQATLEQKRWMYLRAYASVLSMTSSVWKERNVLERHITKIIRPTFKFKGK